MGGSRLLEAGLALAGADSENDEEYLKALTEWELAIMRAVGIE
jgi:hypothetical protein